MKSTRIHCRSAGVSHAGSSLILVVCLCVVCIAQPVRAAIVVSGDVDPADPATWDTNTAAYIGKTSNGTLDITDDSDVSDEDGYIGSQSGSAGLVTVDGIDSTWTNDRCLYVGHYGNGTLDIKGGGAVNNDSYGYIGYGSTSYGLVNVDGAGSTWTNDSSLYIGRYSSGTLNITAGGAVSNGSGYIGNHSGSTGLVTVDGTDSTWANSSNLYVGGGNDGTLNITGGGVVSNTTGSIGVSSGSTGLVTVDGAGSKWTNSSDLRVGYYGNGTLDITGGGLVSVAGALTIDHDGGDDSFINMSTGGMLALNGEADNSLTDFLNMVSGTGTIRYWDDSVSDWADITGATRDVDYTLNYMTEGDLAGYTVLTVPEPVTLSLLVLGGVALLRRGESPLRSDLRA